MRVSGQSHAIATLPLGKCLRAYCTRDLVGNPGPLWTGMEKRKYISLNGDRTPNRPARTESLYRIRCLDTESLY